MRLLINSIYSLSWRADSSNSSLSLAVEVRHRTPLRCHKGRGQDEDGYNNECSIAKEEQNIGSPFDTLEALGLVQATSSDQKHKDSTG